MAKNFKEQAIKFIGLGLNPVPVEKGSKVPLRKEHPTKITLEEVNNFNWSEIGISTGYSSNNLEVLDWDLKNEEDPDKLLNDFMDLVGKELLQKLVVQSTPSGGFHFLYRCDNIESSQKLAKNEKGMAIIETRGIGGYIKCWPSEGYEMVKKTFEEIPFITSEERFKLFVSARKLNRLILQDSKNRIPKEQKEYQSKFPDYDSDPEIGLKMLEDAGWTRHSEVGSWINLTRPGKEISDGMSGGYNLEGNFLYVFSTSQDNFLIERPYSNHQIFAELECKGNYEKAYALLFKNGHGVDGVDDENDISFLSEGEEEDEYLEQSRKGEIDLGLTLGWKSLDSYIRLKRNSFLYILGLDNIGKSTLLSSILAASKVLHGFKWGISSPEALTYTTRRDLIEAESGRGINSFKEDPDVYYEYLKGSREHFHIIKNDNYYTIDDILEKGKILYHIYGIDYLLIDPFSFYLGSGQYNDDVEVLSKIRIFCQNYCGVIVVDHPYTGFTRTKDEHGYIKMPTKYDASGGNTKANKCDDFLSLHRIINHENPLLRRTMQLSVQKVKDKSTGGEPHLEGDYSTLVWEERDGFTGYWDEFGNNPMYTSLTSKQGAKRSGLGDRNKTYKPF